MDIPGQPCVLCRIQGEDQCYYQDELTSDTTDNNGWSAGQSTDAFMLGTKRKRPLDHLSGSNRSSAEFRSENTPDLPPSKTPQRDRRSESGRHGPEDSQNESVFIVGPVVADDAQVIEKFMPPKTSNERVQPKSHPYNVYSNDPKKPILYTTVSRRRQGVRVGTPPGENQKEILEQVLGPFKDVLVKLYVAYNLCVSYSFPNILYTQIFG